MQKDNTFEYDKHNLKEVIENYHVDINNAYNSIKEEALSVDIETINKIVLCGMGGSAIAGEIVQTLFNYHISNKNKITFFVNREYDLPTFTDENTLVILSSYSGNTEETLACAKEAKEVTENILVISAGGKLSEMARDNMFDLVILPEGFQPRCALNYSLISLLVILHNSGLILNDINFKKTIKEIIVNYEIKTAIYNTPNEENSAFMMAKDMFNKSLVIYSENKYYGAVSLRFRQHFQENAKHFSSGNVLPEMNHNEINSWNFPQDILSNSFVLLLRDNEIENDRMQLRFKALTNVLNDKNVDVAEFEPEGSNIVTRMFDAFLFADWASYYLAMKNKVDPSDIPLINYLKDYLDKH